MLNVNFTDIDTPLVLEFEYPDPADTHFQEKIIAKVNYSLEYTSDTKVTAEDAAELTEVMVNATLSKMEEMKKLTYEYFDVVGLIEPAPHMAMFSRGVETAHQMLINGLLRTSKGQVVSIEGTTLSHIFGLAKLKNDHFGYIAVTIVNAKVYAEHFGVETKMDVLRIMHATNYIQPLL